LRPGQAALKQAQIASSLADFWSGAERQSLYAYTAAIRILYEVFRTRFEGGKLPSAEAVKHTRAVGDLVYTERVPGPQPGRGTWCAMLLRDDGESYIIPVLDRAHIRKIRGGILISGVEVVPRGRGDEEHPVGPLSANLVVPPCRPDEQRLRRRDPQALARRVPPPGKRARALS
jgi:hypothetical protein